MYQVNGITDNGWFRLKYNNEVAYVSADIKYTNFSEDVGGVINMADLNELKKQLKIPSTTWATQEVQKAKANGLIKSDHDTEELVTFGTMITVINNLYDQLKKK
jgi:hypothetical protein